MATSRKETSKHEGFLQAAWDQMGDMTYYHTVSLAVRLLPTKRRGVFLLEVSAYRQIPNSGFKRVARYTVEWPHSTEMSFSAQLFAATNQLDKLLMEENPARKPNFVWKDDK